MVILDTNIIIDHLRFQKDTSYFRHLEQKLLKETFCISLITIQELYQGLSTKNEEQEKDMLSVINSLKILPYTYDIAKLAGTITRDLRRPIALADAVIAATAIQNHIELITLNTKDFHGIPSLRLYAS